MTKVTMTIEGLDRLRSAADQYPRRVAAALAEALEESGFIIEGRAKEALTYGPTRAIKTGYLRDTTRFYRFRPAQLVAEIYSIAQYAIYVHEGTGTHKRIGPRPYMKVAAEKAGPQVQKAFDAAIAKALNIR